jgi:hypothetical protein
VVRLGAGIQAAGFIAIVVTAYLIEPLLLLGIGGLAGIVIGQALSKE